DPAAGRAALLEADGARVLVCPAVEIVPAGLTDELRAAIARLAGYDTVIFTSANGVAVFCQRLRDCGLEPAALGACELVAIGPATALALEEHGLTASVVPEEFVAEGVLDAIEHRARRLAGRRVLLPRAREARALLPDELRRRGAVVDVVVVYDTVPAAGLTRSPAEIAAADYITFTSSSTARHFVTLMGGGDLAVRLAGVRLASIGPVTSATLRELGLDVAVEAAVYSAAGLAAALAADAGRPATGSRRPAIPGTLSP
ncbi:MAG TPA: uroporphyrinogen-III synthase, partial [Thermoleophilia bacterium]|nr:uroporphyrinogen-III synthase [Thermoleophilia bacterium]